MAAANPFNPVFASHLWDNEVPMARVHLAADLLSCHDSSPSLILGSHLHLGADPQLPGTDLQTHRSSALHTRETRTKHRGLNIP